MTHETRIKLARLKGHLRGMRWNAKATIRSTHNLANDYEGTGAGVAYSCARPQLVSNLRNIRAAERMLDVVIEEAENDRE